MGNINGSYATFKLDSRQGYGQIHQLWIVGAWNDAFITSKDLFGTLALCNTHPLSTKGWQHWKSSCSSYRRINWMSWKQEHASMWSINRKSKGCRRNKSLFGLNLIENVSFTQSQAVRGREGMHLASPCMSQTGRRQCSIARIPALWMPTKNSDWVSFFPLVVASQRCAIEQFSERTCRDGRTRRRRSKMTEAFSMAIWQFGGDRGGLPVAYHLHPTWWHNAPELFVS